MSNQYFLSSLTRIADLDDLPFEVKPLSRSQWATGDYVLAEVIPPLNPSAKVELLNGRMANLLPGDSIIGRNLLPITDNFQSRLPYPKSTDN